jgi:uncharacterized lipoprotein YmbA
MKRGILFILCLGGLTACSLGSSQEPNYYELTPVSGTSAPGIGLAIKVQRPSIPAYLDRPDIVRQENDYQYKIDQFSWWAEPLDEMLERILAEDLRKRLPDSSVLTESDTGTMNARYIVNTDIERFNAVDANDVAFKATLSIEDKNGGAPFKPEVITLHTDGATWPDAIAAALSTLAGEYADRVAEALRQQTATELPKQITP